MLNLAAALRARTIATNSDADLQRAVRLLRSAVAEMVTLIERAAAAAALGEPLVLRFERLGEDADLSKAVRAARFSAAGAAAPDPRRSLRRLTLAAALRVAACRNRDTATADESVREARLALDEVGSLPAGHPSRTAALSKLSLALFSRAQLLLAPGGLTEALQLAREAWADIPADDPSRPSRAANLAVVLSAFDDRGSIEMLQEIIDSLPAGHVRRSAILVNLSAARYETPDPIEQRRAIDNWREAALDPAAVTTDRLEAAHRWGAAAQRLGLADQTLAAHRCTAELLPRVSWRGIGTASRQNRSSDGKGWPVRPRPPRSTSAISGPPWNCWKAPAAWPGASCWSCGRTWPSSPRSTPNWRRDSSGSGTPWTHRRWKRPSSRPVSPPGGASDHLG